MRTKVCVSVRIRGERDEAERDTMKRKQRRMMQQDVQERRSGDDERRREQMKR